MPLVLYYIWVHFPRRIYLILSDIFWIWPILTLDIWAQVFSFFVMFYKLIIFIMKSNHYRNCPKWFSLCKIISNKKENNVNPISNKTLYTSLNHRMNRGASYSKWVNKTELLDPNPWCDRVKIYNTVSLNLFGLFGYLSKMYIYN